MKSVAVFGSSRAAPRSRAYELARELGAALARRGAEVRCGGYAGVMAGVAEGARSAGGRVVGCTIEWFADARTPNEHLSEVVGAGDLAGRIARLLDGTSAAIALPGGIGTLNELFWVWTLLLHGKADGRRLIALGSEYLDLMQLLTRRFEVDPPIRDLAHVAASVDEAADLACEAQRR